jgi:predicted secreted Zn-dependent protease
MLDTPNTIVNYTRLQDLTDDAQMKLLQHEQGHTDLAVVYGRLLYRQLSAQTYTSLNFKTKTRDIYLKLMKELAEENRRYDVATEHGFDDEKQQIWAIEIAKKLSTT